MSSKGLLVVRGDLLWRCGRRCKPCEEEMSHLPVSKRRTGLRRDSPGAADDGLLLWRGAWGGGGGRGEVGRDGGVAKVVELVGVGIGVHA